MRIRISLIWWLVLSSCTLQVYEPEKMLPVEEYSEWTTHATYVSQTANSVTLDVELILSDKFDRNNEFTFLGSSDFNISGSGGQLTISDFKTATVANAGPGSSVILMDVSGDYAATDPYNNRAKMFHKYFEDHNGGSQFLTGGFAKSGLLSAPIYYLSEQFQTTEDQILLPFFNMLVQTGGQNNLYDALNSGISKLTATTGSARHLIVLTHNNDGGSSFTPGSIIAAAKSASVKIDIVALGKDLNPSPLAAIACQSGGLFAFCQSGEEMIAVTGRLYRMLYGTTGTCQFRLVYKPTSGIVASGDQITGSINVSESVFGKSLNPTYFSVSVP
ncbi:MAG: VWA domain-containing protein [Bacteroidetes bacterium]|nr:VWA domain-containing protein [Bacteroidota bacterium]